MSLPSLPRMNPQKLTPKARVTGTYLRPLLRDAVGLVDPLIALKKLKSDLLRRMRKMLTQETFSKAAKKALSQALVITIGPSSLIIVAKHPAWKPLVEGQRKGPMAWLQKARRPIPIITESGKLIFRTCSARSLANGRWIHPGHQKRDFYERARKEAKDFLKKKLAGQVRQQLMQAFR